MKALRVLSVSSLFPNTAQPSHGIFLEHRLKYLNQRRDVEVRIVAPIPWFPFSHKIFKTYGLYARASQHEERAGIQVLHPRFPVIAKVGVSATPLLMALWIARTLSKIRKSGFAFDVIDAYYLYPDGVAAALLGRWFNVPVVLTAFGSDVSQIPQSRLPRAQIIWAMRQAQGLTAVCDALRTQMNLLASMPGRVHVVMHGVDLVLFSPPVDRSAARSSMGLQGPTLLSAGSLIPRKGHDIAISALPMLPGIRLLVAGTGPLERVLRAQAQALGVSDRVSFLGQLSQHQLAVAMGAVDALTLCSDREGIANVLMEVMACGTPPIATPIWGTPEIISSPSVGVLMRDRSPEALAEGVRTLLSSPIDRAAVRKHAEKFTWASTVAQHVTVLRDAVSDYRSLKANGNGCHVAGRSNPSVGRA